MFVMCSHDFHVNSSIHNDIERSVVTVFYVHRYSCHSRFQLFFIHNDYQLNAFSSLLAISNLHAYCRLSPTASIVAMSFIV